MEKIYEKCPGCESLRKSVIATESFKNNKYEIGKCSDCQLMYTTYQSDDTNEYYGHSRQAWMDKYGPILRKEKLHDRHLNYLEEVAIINSVNSQGRHLDVGCNAGWLLGYLQEHTSLELYGLEPSPLLAEIAHERLGIKIFNDYAKPSVLPDQFFDSISMTDVFEHIPNPKDVLNVLKKSLKPGGHLIIKVPNGDFTYFKYKVRHLTGPLLNNTDHFNAKEHLIHFSLNNLNTILLKNGFKIIKSITPKPIQTRGSSSISILGREIVYKLSQLNFVPAQDLLVVAKVI